MAYRMSEVKSKAHNEAIVISERLITFAKTGKIEAAMLEAKKLRDMKDDLEDLVGRIEDVYGSSIKYASSYCGDDDIKRIRDG